jgi:hypothetical protein
MAKEKNDKTKILPCITNTQSGRRILGPKQIAGLVVGAVDMINGDGGIAFESSSRRTQSANWAILHARLRVPNQMA